MHAHDSLPASREFEGYCRTLRERDGDHPVPVVYVEAARTKILELFGKLTEGYGKHVRCILLNSYEMDGSEERFAEFPHVPCDALISETRRFSELLLNDGHTSIAVRAQDRFAITELSKQKVLMITEAEEGESEPLLEQFGIPYFDESEMPPYRPTRPQSNQEYFKKYAQLTAGLIKICSNKTDLDFTQ